MTATANEQKTGRAVAGEELFESLAHFVVTHDGQSPERAERIADQAVAFVVTAATATVPMVPSDDVDLGLHALILHTKEYARCASGTRAASSTTTRCRVEGPVTRRRSPPRHVP